MTSRDNLDVGIEDLKRAFLARYNPMRSAERALRAGLQAATQRNPLYRPGLPARDRGQVRSGWIDLLATLLEKYSRPMSAAIYEHDIETLADDMNTRFGDHLMAAPHPRYGYDPGFRISHAQKSLGVALKHLWCLGESAIPPQCPVDGVVLRRAGLRYPATHWAFVNTVEQHRLHISALTTAAEASGRPLAEWELRRFAR